MPRKEDKPGFLENSLSITPSPPGTGLTAEQKREFDNYFRGKGMSKKFFLEHYRPLDGFSLAPTKEQLRALGYLAPSA